MPLKRAGLKQKAFCDRKNLVTLKVLKNGMQRTADVHDPIADARFPQAARVVDDAAALDAAVDVLDPEPTVVQGLVHPLLLPCQFLARGFLPWHEDLDLGQREREEAQIL